MSSPRSILMTTDAVGGVWQYSLELSRGLGRQGVHVTLVVMGPPPSTAQRAELEQLANVTLFEHSGALEWMDQPWRGVDDAGRFLEQLVRERRPELVHLNQYCHGALELGVPKLVVGHSCVLSWWTAVEGSSLPTHLAEYRARVRAGLAGADLVVAPSRSMLGSLVRHYGPLARSRVIWNGRERPPATPAPKEPLVLCAARIWDRGKNVETLDRAAARLSWPVFVAGEGPQRLQHARWLGSLTQPQLARWYARASVYALPARYEPFGLSVLEAALHGCALVLGDIPSLQELWEGAAELVPVDDAAQLERTLEALIADAPRRQALAERGRRRALLLGGADMTREYLAAYRSLSSADQRRTRAAVGAA